MSKKKDFKGLASSILTNKLTSLDDFFDSEENGIPGTEQPQAEQKPEPIRQNPIKREKKASSKKKPVVDEEPEKIRMSIFLASRASFDLDELKMNIRRLAPRQDLSKISKSSIVEAAVEIVKADFEEFGMESDIVQKILK